MFASRESTNGQGREVMGAPRLDEPSPGTRTRGTGRFGALLIAGATLCVGCSTLRVTTDYDPDADFSGWRSFAWLSDRPMQGGDPRLHNDLVDARVRGAVDRALAERGFEKAPEASADFLVAYYVGLETRIDVRTVHNSARYSRRGWSGGVATSTQVRQYEMGTLLLDMLDPTDRRLVWRGSANARIRERSDPAQRAQQIDEAVQSILDRFPPR